MDRKLKGERYLKTRRNEPLARFILEDLRYLDYQETLDWYVRIVPHLDLNGRALLGCNDRYFLLTGLLRRVDLLHPWLFDRCREVEKNPDGHIDLWARYHGKTSCISIGGAIQEIMIDPEITIAIFSAVKPLATAILDVIKVEFEGNDYLKAVYSDVLYSNPKGKGADGRPSKWSLARGITVKRRGNPKEATIEGHGLIDGQPTGRHFQLHIYDDVVTQDFIGDDQLKKTTERWEMADNLGTLDGCRKWIVGTRYHYGDCYGVIMDRKAAKPRIYPATEDGTLKGDLVLLTPERWVEIQKTQKSSISAQMLLKPNAGTDATFNGEHFRSYDVYPAILNVYITVDSSKGRTQRSDRTAIIVTGIDPAGNKYLLDGVCHRMSFTERLEWINTFRKRWINKRHVRVQGVRVGYEQYGMQSDIEVIEAEMRRRGDHFHIEELGTPQRGPHGKNDRIERLEPDIRRGVYYLPAVVWHPDRGGWDGMAIWKPWTKADAEKVKVELADKRARGEPSDHIIQHEVGHIVYYPMGRGRFPVDPNWRSREPGSHNPSRIGDAPLTRAQRAMEAQGLEGRIVRPLKRRDEHNAAYDVTREAIDELIRHPFAKHDDIPDAMSRIHDMNPQPPDNYEESDVRPFLEDAPENTYGDADYDA